MTVAAPLSPPPLPRRILRSGCRRGRRRRPRRIARGGGDFALEDAAEPGFVGFPFDRARGVVGAREGDGGVGDRVACQAVEIFAGNAQGGGDPLQVVDRGGHQAAAPAGELGGVNAQAAGKIRLGESCAPASPPSARRQRRSGPLPGRSSSPPPARVTPGMVRQGADGRDVSASVQHGDTMSTPPIGLCGVRYIATGRV